jgi:hypothetical protein
MKRKKNNSRGGVERNVAPIYKRPPKELFLSSTYWVIQATFKGNFL